MKQKWPGCLFQNSLLRVCNTVSCRIGFITPEFVSKVPQSPRIVGFKSFLSQSPRIVAKPEKTDLGALCCGALLGAEVCERQANEPGLLTSTKHCLSSFLIGACKLEKIPPKTGKSQYRGLSPGLLVGGTGNAKQIAECTLLLRAVQTSSALHASCGMFL